MTPKFGLDRFVPSFGDRLAKLGLLKTLKACAERFNRHSLRDRKLAPQRNVGLKSAEAAQHVSPQVSLRVSVRLFERILVQPASAGCIRIGDPQRLAGIVGAHLGEDAAPEVARRAGMSSLVLDVSLVSPCTSNGTPVRAAATQSRYHAPSKAPTIPRRGAYKR